MALLQVLGIASILPFMQLAAEPEAIQTNKWLNWAYTTFGFESSRQMLIYTGIGVLTLLTLGNAFSAFTTWLQHKFAWDVAHQMATRLLRTYLSRPYRFFLTRNSSDLLNNTLVEVVQVTRGVLLPLTELAARTLVILVIFLLLVLVDPMLAFIVLAVLLAAYGIVYVGVRKLLERLGKARLEANERLFKSLNEVLTGIKIFRVYGAQNFFYRRFEQASEKLIKIHPKVVVITATPRYVIEILAFGSIIGLTIYLLVSNQNLQSALPMLSLYAVAGYRLLPALQAAFTAITKFRHSVPLLDKIHGELTAKYDDNYNIEESDSIPVFSEQLTLNNVSFHYEASSQNVLADINLEIPKGKTVAFVGATGSGKTTLIDLIVGLLEPKNGEVLIDQNQLKPSNASSWQKQIGYVPQDVFLFDDTILRNIAIGQEDNEVDTAQVENAAKLAQIHEFIANELPNGYKTTIGERGIRMSGGQRQRMGLARALYRNPQVMIFDEATSALDGITENAVLEALETIADELTVFIIAHRLATVRHADCIFLLEAGKIVAQGTYDELLESSSVFREMVQLS